METKAINTKLKGHARVDVADVLRGLAVMGIIILHSIEHFNFYSFPDTAGQSAWLNFSDKAIWSGLFFMFGGKAYAIFALLFGFSFFIQDDNQRLRLNTSVRRISLAASFCPYLTARRYEDGKNKICSSPFTCVRS